MAIMGTKGTKKGEIVVVAESKLWKERQKIKCKYAN